MGWDGAGQGGLEWGWSRNRIDPGQGRGGEWRGGRGNCDAGGGVPPLNPLQHQPLGPFASETHPFEHSYGQRGTTLDPTRLRTGRLTERRAGRRARRRVRRVQEPIVTKLW